jgi:hypothetical protein
MKLNIINKCFLVILLSLKFTLPAICQTENFSSRIFFPGAVGLNIPSGDEQTSIKAGFSLLTAIEYRPHYTDNIFFRFNYDVLSNKYISLPSRIPTNVTQGKLSASFLVLGVGYRHSVGRYAIYALAQPGFNLSSYSRVSDNSTGISISNVSRDHPALKFSTGIEYYIVPHFALVAEPGFYHSFEVRHGFILNSNYLSYNIGFTTTLF